MRSVCLLGVLLFALSAPCQNEIIEIDKPFEAQGLSGKVRVGDDPAGVKGALVEYCTPHWKSTTDSTHTDETGSFSFPKMPKRKLHYLRLSFPGAHTVLIKVRITRSGPKDFSLALPFRT